MNNLARHIASVIAMLIPAIIFAQNGGPADRKVTNPRSIDSPANPRARPIPIDDLYYTRLVSRAS